MSDLAKGQGSSIKRMVFLVTTNNDHEAFAKLRKMLDSVVRFSNEPSAPELRVFLLLQNANDGARQNLETFLPAFVRLREIDHRVSLSKARNILLEDGEVRASIEDDIIVGFPDDDCWFPDGTLLRLTGDFGENPRLDQWFCRYGTETADPTHVVGRRPALQTVIAKASSNTMYMRGRVIQAVGLFDEKLGVGAAINGGEDTDFALRAHRLARETLFLDVKAIGHRDFNPQHKARYYPGSLVAILRHARGGLAGYPAALRKLLVGGLLLARGRISSGEIISAIRQAFQPVAITD